MTKKKVTDDTVKEPEEHVTTEAETIETNPLEEENKALKSEVEQFKDQLLRNQAELQNFKRRMNDERIKDRKFAISEVVKYLLAPLDNFEIGLANEKQDGKLKPELKGFEMIRRDFMNILESQGLKEVEALNQPFDPNYHQAVVKEETEGVEPNIVVEVYQKGYMFKDRLLRPAMVKVSE